MAKTKMVLRVPTFGLKAGDEVSVDSEQVDALVKNGHAYRKADAPAEAKGGK